MPTKRGRRPRRLKSSLRTAWLCGALPILAGLSVFVAWVITRQSWLMMAGLWTIAGGTALCVLGLIELAHFYSRAVLRSARPRRVLLVSGATLALLLAGFPLALVLSVTAAQLATSYRVTIQNTASQPLEAARLFGGGRDKLIGTIAAGDEVTRSLRFNRDGQLEFEAQLSGRPVHAMVEGYVTSGMGGQAVVTVDSDGQAQVTRPALD